MVGACSPEAKQETKPQRTFPVMVGSVTEKNVPVQLQSIGTVEAYESLSVKSQVGGVLSRVNFQEGQDVRRGDLLLVIDPRPFESGVAQAEANLNRDKATLNQLKFDLERDETAVKQAEANLSRDQAQAEYARKEAERYQSLAEKGYVSKEQYDQFRTNSEALEATVKADLAAVENARAIVKATRAAGENAQASVHASEASLENARLLLSYCYIRSPIDGRTGSLQIKQGSLVKANDDIILGINQIRPIYATFSIPEQNLPEIQMRMAAGKLSLHAFIPGGEKRPEEGVLTFVDSAVDSSTGTIRLKGTFANSERRLWPGQFVNVVLILSVQRGAVVAPAQAVQTGPQGSYVFVVKADQTVEVRPVAVARSTDGESVIAEGLKPGETVVTDGHLHLFPGARVEIKNPVAGEKRS